VCGIAGIADPAGLRDDDPHLVDTMLRTLAHRGPDDHVVQAEPGAVLGARRLSIIDLEGGRQPVENEDGSVVATQNGEIYNYVELREHLLARGHSLRSDGDTETIVHLYEDYGVRFVDHLRGMFAIALWDVARGRLILARDRLGKKPLYWRLAGGRISYGSELKALLADPSLERTVDQDALAIYLGYQYVPSPLSILTGVRKLPPASVLTWDGGEPRVERYWTPRYEPKVARTLEDDRDALLDVLSDAVRLRLRSDVPVGCFLSGGMDSSVVTGLMARLSAEPVRTFSIGFDVPAYDESRYAQAVASHFSTRHTSEIVTLDAIALLPDLARAFDEPFGDSSAIPTLRVAQLASREVKVVLTGDGGDETFGGYDRYALDERLERLAGVPLGLSRTASATAAKLLGAIAPRSRLRRRARTLTDLTALGPDERYDRQMRMMSPELEGALLPGRARSSVGHISGRMAADAPAERIDRLLRTDMLNYLPEDLLVKMDRATMAVSLEARSPLLDQEVVAFAARLPGERKLHAGRSKILLREVARMLLPPELVERPKMGFAIPTQQWFLGALGDRVAELALAPDAFVRDVIDQSVAAGLLAEHRARTHDHGRRLWQLLALELWGRTWVRQPVPVG
jgi:asparagine synthase (glutamine-hydrolysing)